MLGFNKAHAAAHPVLKNPQHLEKNLVCIQWVFGLKMEDAGNAPLLLFDENQILRDEK
jgi:hypothetical protein